MKTILATAYDINPYKGSESGTGWNFIMQISRFNKVLAVTRKNNRYHIEKFVIEKNLNTKNINFIYFDLPTWMSFWKRGSRGSSLYFYLWQMFLPIYIFYKKFDFDISHNINFHTDIFPTFLWLLPKPLVWGPISHHEKIPKTYIRSKSFYLKDRLVWLIKLFMWKFDPFIFLSKKYSNIILIGNSSVPKRLKLNNNKIIKLTQVGINPPKINNSLVNQSSFNIIFVGRLVDLKGVELAIYSFDKFFRKLTDVQKKKTKLFILGRGLLKSKLEKIKIELKNKNIELIGFVNQNQIDEYYQNSKVFIFPSFEGAGMVVVEAMANGLPVICFDNYGPGELINDDTGFKITYSNFNQSIDNFSEVLHNLFLDKKLQTRMSKNARILAKDMFSWNSKGDLLKDLYNKLA